MFISALGRHESGVWLMRIGRRYGAATGRKEERARAATFAAKDAAPSGAEMDPKRIQGGLCVRLTGAAAYGAETP
jgi:hypothetical protein